MTPLSLLAWLLAGAGFGAAYFTALWLSVTRLTAGGSAGGFALAGLLRLAFVLVALALALTRVPDALGLLAGGAGFLGARIVATRRAARPARDGALSMAISPDAWVILDWGGLRLNATVVFTWAVMALLVLGSWTVTARLSTGEHVSRWQVLLETIVTAIRDQIAEIGAESPGRYLPFVGTLFLFIATANLLTILPVYVPPTGSLSTTAALAICVLIAVPVFSIGSRRIGDYLKTYLRPTPLMLPFNLIAEVSRTIALAVRLYGNVMSGTVIVGILISVAPFFFPVLLQLLGLLTGLVQAYIFAVLAMVYIASASRTYAAAGAEPPRDAPGSKGV